MDEDEDAAEGGEDEMMEEGGEDELDELLEEGEDEQEEDAPVEGDEGDDAADDSEEAPLGLQNRPANANLIRRDASSDEKGDASAD